MGSVRIKIGSGFIVIAALLYFFDTSGLFAAMFAAAIIHECGHILAILLSGGKITGMRADVFGFHIDYACKNSFLKSFARALSGPAAGLIAGVLMARLSNYLASDYLTLTAGVSVVLSAFNLAPCLPLDGGQACMALLAAVFGEAAAEQVMFIIGIAVSSLAFVAGLCLVRTGYGWALVPAGVYLFIYNIKFSCQSSGSVIK